ncbi:hypothetical protein Gdia_0545 [Gluconacetobacter diazotrophicus PA1 5]|nr:hypothetical protein Gdia_0545 [Gluconacetobacter diazotrophicus PA1 5]
MRWWSPKVLYRNKVINLDRLMSLGDRNQRREGMDS